MSDSTYSTHDIRVRAIRAVREEQLPVTVVAQAYGTDQTLAEGAEVDADEAAFVGLTFLLRDGRSGFGDGQAQPALEVPRQSGHDHILGVKPGDHAFLFDRWVEAHDGETTTMVTW